MSHIEMKPPILLMSVADFAEMHEVPIKRVRRAIQSQMIPVIKVGSRIRIDMMRLPDDYALFLDKKFLTGKQERETKVYFIGPKDGPIKIGVAANPVSRLAALQIAHWQTLLIHTTTAGGTYLEREYHQRFAEHRLLGEWFEPHPDILAEIKRLNG